MNRGPRPRIVVLGMMTKMPVAGVVWQTLHYLLGFERLGYETYYVETHGRTPSMLMAREEDDGAALAANFIGNVLRRFDLGDRWAFHALHDDGRVLGLSERELERLYGSAAMILDLHGGTEPRPELWATDRLVYLETDPVQLQHELAGGYQPTYEFLEPHCAFFTFAENLGADDCGLPVSQRFPFLPTRQPVAVDLWQTSGPPAHERFTTIGNWRQQWRNVEVGGDVYTWSKHHEFEKFLDLPTELGPRFELALSSYEDENRQMLEDRGWRVLHALDFSTDLDAYREYIGSSYGEFSAAKDQNVRMRTGWFSDRSATYLASGRPIVVQDTGFGRVLPTGEGLFAFSSAEGVIDAVERIDREPERHRRAARDTAREFFAPEVVLGQILEHLGLPVHPSSASGPGELRPGLPFPYNMSLTPVSRRPTVLPPATVAAVLESNGSVRHVSRPAPNQSTAPEGSASVVVVSFDSNVFTRLCLETVLAAGDAELLEVIVVDNGSSDGSVEHLLELAERDPRVKAIANRRNLGFPTACNQGLAVARGDSLVLLNSDTMVAPGWLARLLAHLGGDPGALVGPVTNRIGNEAEVPVEYETWGGFLREARRRGDHFRGRAFEIPTLTMFCLAMSRESYETLGPLDDRFGLGTLEDDDYSQRARRAGLRLLCAEDVLVHHFGEASFGKLFADGEYSRVIARNRERFQEKWGEPWQPYGRREDPAYEALVDSFRRRVPEVVPAGSTVLVVSKGDDRLVNLDGVEGWHFPRTPEGVWAGHHPADSEDAIGQLLALREAGAEYLAFPRSSYWWLDHYQGLALHLGAPDAAVARHDACVVFPLLAPQAPEAASAGPAAERTA